MRFILPTVLIATMAQVAQCACNKGTCDDNFLITETLCCAKKVYTQSYIDA